MTKQPAYLGLGSNLNDRLSCLIDALVRIRRLTSIDIVQLSSVYETEPVGYADQSDFLNTAVAVQTVLSPPELLLICQTIERKMGRVPTRKWGPRNIDIDILMFGNIVKHTEELTLPHKELTKRKFVLLPLAEIAADVIVTETSKTVKQLLQEISDIHIVTKVLPASEFVKKLKEACGG